MKVEKTLYREFARAADAIYSEILYQDNLERRTDDEAKDVPGFLTLLRRYIRQTEDVWVENPGTEQEDGLVQVTAALDGLRKIAAIATRAMIYNGIRQRV